MRQLSLFENQVPDVEPLLKAAMNRAAKRCGLSREQIVDRMNEIAGMGGLSMTPWPPRPSRMTSTGWCEVDLWKRLFHRTVCFIRLFCVAWKAASVMDDTLYGFPTSKGRFRRGKLVVFTKAYRIGMN